MSTPIRPALLAAVALAVAAAAPASASASGSHRCSQHAYGSMKLTPQVVVFAGRENPNGTSGRRIWACRRPGGAARLVGIELPDDGEYGSDSTIGDVQVAGAWVLATITRGAAAASACSKYMLGGQDCPTPATVLRVLDTRSGRAGELPVSSPTAVALSPSGALAWLDGGVLQATALRPRGQLALAFAPRELDRGAAIANLRFAGRTVLWQNAGAARSQLIPAA